MSKEGDGGCLSSLTPGGWGGRGVPPEDQNLKQRRRKVAAGTEKWQKIAKNRKNRFEPGPRSARRAGFFEKSRKMAKNGISRENPGKGPFWGGPNLYFVR